MINVKPPFSSYELSLAIATADGKLSDNMDWEAEIERKLKECDFDLQHKSMKELTALAAAYHGITVESLITSPNFEALRTEFVNSEIETKLIIMFQTLGLDRKEAWAVVVFGLLQAQAGA